MIEEMQVFGVNSLAIEATVCREDELGSLCERIENTEYKFEVYK